MKSTTKDKSTDQMIESLKRAQRIAKIGSWDWNIVDNTESWSDEQFRIFGYELLSVKPNHQLFIDSIHKDDKVRVFKAIDDILTYDTPFDLEYRIHCHQGQLKWIHSQGYVYRDDKGDPIRMIGTMHDITNRKVTARQLSESNQNPELSDTILKNIGHFILAANTKGDIFYTSNSIFEKLGFTQEKIVDNNLFINTDRTSREILEKRAYIKDVLKGRVPIARPYETWITDKNNQEHCILWRDTIAPGKALISIGADITERKEAEKIIKDSEQLKNGILSSLSTHIGVLDSDGVLFATNDSWEKYSETIKQKKTTRPKKGENYLLKIKASMDTDKFSIPIYNGIITVMERKEKYFYADYQSSGGKGKKWFTLRVTPFGNGKGVVITHTSITDRITANLALKASERKFRQLTESIQEAFWLTDWETKEAIYVNPAYKNIYGHSHPNLLNDMNWAAYIHKEDKKWVSEEYRTKAESGNYDVEFRILDPSGEIRWIHERAFPIKENGEILRMAGYSSDITDRRKAQNELAKSEEQYRLLFERNLAGVYRATIDNVIIECNDSFAKIIGFKSREEVLEKNTGLLYQHADAHDFHEKLAINGGNLTGFESQLTLNDGRTIRVLENVSIVKENGKEAFIEGTIIDITKLKDAEVQIEALAKFPEENPNPVLRINRSNHVIYVNQAGSKLIKHITIDSKKLIAFYSNIVEQAISLNKIVEIEKKVGNNFYAFSIRPVKEHNYVNIYGKDITQRTRIDLIREITFTISRKASSKIRSISSLSKIIHNELAKVIPAKSLYLALYDKKTNGISFPYHKDEDIEINNAKTYMDREFDHGLTEQVLISKKAMLIKGQDILNYIEERIQDYDKIPKSWIGVPLIQNEEVFGVLALQSYHDEQAYTEESVEFLDFVAGQLAGLIERVNSTALILKQQKDLNSEKEKLKDQRDLALQYQSMLLSSQLNPHFIFNSLNSIQYFILDKDPLPALNFLTDFSSLMRSVLNNSAQKYITLTEEITFLEMYLNLELKRYSDKFRYEIIIREDFNTDEILIPPMLLQPFLENTVIHGVGNLMKDGLITIELNLKKGKVEFVITDNGVGREEAARLKVMRKGDSSKSWSTDINSSRLEILNQLEYNQYSAKVKDRTDQKGKSIGTQVIVTIPISLDE